MTHPHPSRPFSIAAAVLVLVLVLLAAPFPIAAETLPYATYLDEAYAVDGPGATAIVVKDGEVLYRGARGMADLELGVALAPEHVFRLGSITKQFTAAAILLLAEEGKLSVADEITKYLPDYPTHGHTITIEHLLTHTSGVFSYTNIPGYMMGAEIRADLTTEELVDVFDEYGMEFAPGERWNYSNSGYVLLGAIIEKVSGLAYDDFVKARIFEPLGMANSHYGGLQLIPRRVAGYTGSAGGYRNANFLSMTQPHAAGSLLSTVDDLARWNAGLFGGELLSAESLERMTNPFVLNDGEATEYAYGFAISDFRGSPSISHGGGIHGFSTYAMWLPEEKVYVAVLSNIPSNPVRPDQVALQMAAEAIGKPFPRREAIEVDPETLEEYVGVYRIDDETTRAVTLDDGKLYTQRTGGQRLEIKPHAEDAFFYEQSFTHLTFERDADGHVTAMHMFANGAEEAEVAVRLAGEAAPKAPEREVADVSPELYDLWAGRYEIAPGFVMEIRREGDSLITQATGQPGFEIYPASMRRYFVKDFPAEIEFFPGADGRAEAIVLYQGGREIRAERVD